METKISFVESHDKFKHGLSGIRSFRVIQLDDNEFVHLNEYDDMDAAVEMQIYGLTWLDSVTHLLECYGEERTHAYSGFVVKDYKSLFDYLPD
jgi:hypothetical protein